LKNAKISILHAISAERYRRFAMFFHLVGGELATGFGWKSESGNFRPIWMIPTPLESSFQSRLRMSHFQTSGKDFSAPKIIQFEIQILLGVNVTIDPFLEKKNGNFALVNFKFLSLKKIF
jgi:hypothetical protein